ncbi:MAG: UDP-N-acetylmuramoyl-L-alanine--D-glutamate ligase [Bacteroidota bacterium]
MRVVALGGGESGVGAAILAKKMNYPIFVSDKGPIKAHYKRELEEQQIEYEENKHTLERLHAAEIIVKSPGIPDSIPLIKALREKGIPIISEIEFAARHTNAVIIGITGSNGKTTTTNLTYHLLQSAGLSVGIGGNVGQSFARLIATDKRDYYVLELSSFQLDGIWDFRPHLAVLLNITPDHLDRYDYQMEKYIRSKFRIIRNQQEGDLFLYNADDEAIKGYLQGRTLPQQLCPISSYTTDSTVIRLDDDWVFDMKDSALRGPHNCFNAHCALTIAKALQVDPSNLQAALNSFRSVHHRMEVVAEIDGVEYINDSKATNVDAVLQALKAMHRPIVWVAGGQDKGNDYAPIRDLVREKVRTMICLGADNRRLIEEFGGMVEGVVECQTAEEAVRLGRELALPGEVVLLSPACSSFDLFENFEQRGDLFREAVLALRS